MIDPTVKELPEDVINQVARAYRTDRDGALEAINQHAAPFYAQAGAAIEGYVGQGLAQEVQDWAVNDRKGRELLHKAARAQIDRRDLGGYRELSFAYLQHVAETDPQAIANGLRRGGTPARVVSGKVIITTEDGDEMEFASAVRGGVVKLGR